MSSKIEKIFIEIIRICSYAILFLPLVTTPQTLFFYIFGKQIFLQALVTTAAVFYIPLALYRPAYRPNWKNPLVWGTTAYMAILVVTSVIGVDAALSFWSTQERMTGVVGTLHYWAWLLILTSVFHTWKDWKRFLLVTLAVSCIIGFYGHFAYELRLPFVAFEPTKPARIYATLGNPIYLGLYAVMHIFLALFVALRSSRVWQRIVFAIVALFNVSVLIATASHGALVGLAIGCIIFVTLVIFAIPSRRQKLIMFSVAAGAVAILVTSFIVLQSPAGKKWGTAKLPPFAQSIIYRPLIDQSRLVIWKVGIHGFLERPLTGWGWENFLPIYEKYAPPWHVKAQTWYDRSHNQLIDVLALTGIFGFLAYMILWGSIATLLIKKFLQEKSLQTRLGIAALIALLGSYFAQNLTVFDVPSSLILLYFIFGLTSYLVFQDGEGSNIHAALHERHAYKVPFLASFMIISILGTAMIVTSDINPFIGSSQGIAAIETWYKEGPVAGFARFSQLFAHPSFITPEYRQELAKLLSTLQQYKVSAAVQNEIALASMTELEKTIKNHPLDTKTHTTLAMLYRSAYPLDKSYGEKAEKLLQSAVRISPNRRDLFFQLSDVYVMEGQEQKALEVIEQIRLLAPEQPEAYWKMTGYYMAHKDYQKLFEYARKAYERGFDVFQDPDSYLTISQNITSSAAYPDALFLMNEASRLHPDDFRFLASRIFILQHMGDKNGASRALEEVDKMNKKIGDAIRSVLH